MKKELKNFIVKDINKFSGGTAFVSLMPEQGVLPHILPGQFVNILVDNCNNVFLRRPISICDVDYDKNLLFLYIKNVGKGTEKLCRSKIGDNWNLLLPLGNGFRISEERKLANPLLVGGGVGMAPLVLLGKSLKERGINPTFLLGGNSSDDICLFETFKNIAPVYVTTIDGSKGEKGVVTDHSCLKTNSYDIIYCCGPTPMMKALNSYAKEKGIRCLVSLENRMACGLGACLCCVEDTTEGNRCVCTDGPVFDTNELKW